MPARKRRKRQASSGDESAEEKKPQTLKEAIEESTGIQLLSVGDIDLLHPDPFAYGSIVTPGQRTIFNVHHPLTCNTNKIGKDLVYREGKLLGTFVLDTIKCALEAKRVGADSVILAADSKSALAVRTGVVDGEYYRRDFGRAPSLTQNQTWLKHLDHIISKIENPAPSAIRLVYASLLQLLTSKEDNEAEVSEYLGTLYPSNNLSASNIFKNILSLPSTYKVSPIRSALVSLYAGSLTDFELLEICESTCTSLHEVLSLLLNGRKFLAPLFGVSGKEACDAKGSPLTAKKISELAEEDQIITGATLTHRDLLLINGDSPVFIMPVTGLHLKTSRGKKITKAARQTYMTSNSLKKLRQICTALIIQKAEPQKDEATVEEEEENVEVEEGEDMFD